MNAAPTFSLCVYCGSRPGYAAEFLSTAQAVGRWIGEHGGQLVYGGGNHGLMGAVADATLQHGGRVLGVIPRSLQERECAKTDCTELHIVETMHERKRMMAERADAFLALAGGLGTFEELFEIWTWRQLGYHDKPLGLLNTSGYYDTLLQFVRHSEASGFVSASQVGHLMVGTHPESLLPDLVQQAGLGHNGPLERWV